MRIGILGGTFNPPHLGHLICAQEAYLQLGLDRVTLIPARIPPHKPVEDEPGAQHRLELCRLAIQGDEQRFDVSDLEIGRDGPSYTVDTLEALNSSAPDHELFLIVGGDIAAGLPDWHQAERVLSLATLAVAKRRGTSRAAVDEALGALRGGERTRFFRMPRIAISSTMLRERVRVGESIRYYVPDAVAGYIAQHRLYAGVGSVQ
ncbi:MAG: nicotinate (nicotinamide) nucleotide adenylyltransferase [Solirubrobacterales bacterium]|nr:nicotinate (nicotinamide) nucleotide adenylyltransferase [Solirubrobacterales bacterium]